MNSRVEEQIPIVVFHSSSLVWPRRCRFPFCSAVTRRPVSDVCNRVLLPDADSAPPPVLQASLIGFQRKILQARDFENLCRSPAASQRSTTGFYLNSRKKRVEF